MNNKLKSLKYTVAVFIVIMFLWWFSGGHIIPFIAPYPAPSDVVVLGAVNTVRYSVALVIDFIKNIPK